MSTKTCKNCGASNDASALRCHSCNVLFAGTFISDNATETTVKPSSNESVVCKNCRTQNAPSALKCVSCKAPLKGSMVLSHQEDLALDNKCPNCSASNSPGATRCHQCNAPISSEVIASSTFNATQGLTANNCPSCGYPNQPHATTCVSCAYVLANPLRAVASKTESKSPSKTINPWLKPESVPTTEHFMLAELDSDLKVTSTVEIQCDQEATLNRDLLATSNPTITSDQQAIVYNENGQWYIEDKSKHHSTLLVAGRRLEIKEGDVIVLGNQRYRFSPQSK